VLKTIGEKSAGNYTLANDPVCGGNLPRLPSFSRVTLNS